MKRLVVVLIILVASVMGVSAETGTGNDSARVRDPRFGLGIVMAKGQAWKLQGVVRIGKRCFIENRISTLYFGTHPNDIFHREIENEVRVRCVWYRMQTCPMRIYSAAGILLWFDFDADDTFLERINPDDGHGSWTTTWLGIEAFPTERLPLAIVLEANSTQRADFYMSLGMTFFFPQ